MEPDSQDLESAENDLRNKAAQLGANVVFAVGSGATRQRGEAYRCPSSYSPPASEPPRSTTAPRTGAPRVVRGLGDAAKVLITIDAKSVSTCRRVGETSRTYQVTLAFNARDVQMEAASLDGNVVFFPATGRPEKGVIYVCRAAE
jgi:hypothetical protein